MKKSAALFLGLALCLGLTAPAMAAEEEVVFYHSTYFEETNWDPAFFTQVDDASLAPMIYENLVELQKDGTVLPQLAESWEISEDGTSYTFHLRQGVQWHKGYGEFTSADVKFSIERNGDEALASLNADNIGLANIESIDCPDAYTAVINLKQPDVDFLTRMAMYYSIMLCKAHNDQDGMESLATDPIGTGAFVFDGGTLAVQTQAVANPDWWGDREGGNIDRVISTYITDTNTRYNAFENGELDTIYCFDPEKVVQYQESGYQIMDIPELELLYVGVNMQMPPFDDPLVREAFFHAIDPQYFIDELFYGNESLVATYIPPNSKYSLPEYFVPEYDPAKTKELLTQAGYPNGVDVTIWGCNDALGEPALIVGSYMIQEAGFNVTIQDVDFGVFIDQVRNGTAQMWILYNNTGAIADDTMSRYRSEAYPGSNWCGITDEEYDRLVNAGLAAATEEEKRENFYAAQRRLMDLQALYPVSTYSNHQIFQNNLTGMKEYGDLAFRASTIVKN